MIKNESEKPIYQTPIVVPLGEMAAALGDCVAGSGDAQCSPGPSAGGQCNTGTSPGGECEVGMSGTTKCVRGEAPLNQPICGNGTHPVGECAAGSQK